MQLMKQGNRFELQIESKGVEEDFNIGDARLRFRRMNEAATASPLLEINTNERKIHFYDEAFEGELERYHTMGDPPPDVAIRTVQLSMLRKIVTPTNRIVRV